MPSSSSLQRRFLHKGHFAFMRAVVQGVDVNGAWELYLSTEGEVSDLRRVKRTIAWIRTEFAAAAHRHKKPGTARLVLIDADKLAVAASMQTLADFAAERGLEDFSEAEQTEAYTEAFGAGSTKGSRRTRVIKRQLEALRWLEQLVAQAPGPLDSVRSWFTPAIAGRLERGGMHTIEHVARRINGIGARWWVSVPGVGETKAARILEWVRRHEASIGLVAGPHVDVPRRQLQQAQLDQVVARATAIVPFEKFLVPAALDGSSGRFRAPQEQCMLAATNDYGAIAAWLSTKHDPSGTGNTATQRAYRKEAERLLLWSVLVLGKPLSSLTVEDVNDFKAFLLAPPESWFGPRHQQRWTPAWRPLEGPLSTGALRQSLIILRSMATFLVSQNYLIGNAFAGVSLPREEGRALGSQRSLTFAQWDLIEARLDVNTAALGRRRARAIRWLYATGLRLSEIASVRCGDLEQVEYSSPDGLPQTGWLLDVLGKGNKRRQVPVPARLVDELANELEEHGLGRNVLADSLAGIAILARFEANRDAQDWTASGLAQSIKAFMEGCAAESAPEDRVRLMKASAHWLRHTHCSHALNGRPGRTKGVPIQVVQNNLGHASIGTTSGYLTTERDARLVAMAAFDEPPMSR